jgi:hypothetical protein
MSKEYAFLEARMKAVTDARQSLKAALIERLKSESGAASVPQESSDDESSATASPPDSDESSSSLKKTLTIPEITLEVCILLIFIELLI